MKNFFGKIIAHLKDNSFLKTYFWVCMPILVMILCEIIIYSFNFNTYVRMISDNYGYKLKNLSAENDSTIRNISDFLFILSESDDFIDFVTSERPLTQNSHSTLSIAEQLNMLKESNSYIDEICVVKRTAQNTAIVYNIERNLDEYFEKHYVYADYNSEFWKHYSMPLSGIEYLEPTEVTSEAGVKFVYPIVFSKIGERTLNNNFIIVNIDIGKITDTISDEALTPKTDVIMLHNASGKYYDARKDTYMQIDSGLFSKIKESSENSFFFNDSSAKYIVSYSPENTPFGYSYAMAVPRSDLFSIQLGVLIIAILLLVFALFATFISSKKLIKPWKSLESMFSPTAPSDNTVGFVQRAVEKTIENNSEISEKLLKTLPFVQERYLIELLHSSETADIENAPIRFNYEYFSSVIIKLHRTGKFYSIYSEDDYANIRIGIYNILKTIFSEKYDTFPIQNDNDTIYILLNCKDDNQDEQILTLLRQFEEALKYDRDLITLHIGYGGVYKGTEGLRRSHADASASISALPGVNMLKQNKPEADREHPGISYSLSMGDENKIYNYLLVGNIKEASDLINSILNSEGQKQTDRHMLVQLYVQIIHVIMKAMKARGIPFTEENKNEVEMLYEIMSFDPLEIYETIFKLLERIQAQGSIAQSHVSADKILEYINANFTDELSLNFLADKFNISVSYLSKLIKKHCGVGFANYIAGLRINMVKEMLLNTDKTVTEIYTEAGFNNRRTFIRTFKAFVGVSPTDYRKGQKNP